MNAQCIMVCSGKGGTGKSTVSVLLGACLARLGRKTLLVELDSGLRSVDIIAGVYGRTVYDIEDVLCGRCEGAKAVVPSPLYPGLSVISAPYEGGAVEAAPLGRLLTAMRPYFDFILLDTAAGMGAPFTAASTVADKALLVLTPDPVALRDGKIVADRLLAGGRPQSAVRLVMNRVRRESFGKNAAVTDLDECIDTVGVQLFGGYPRKPRSAAGRGQRHGTARCGSRRCGRTGHGKAFVRAARPAYLLIYCTLLRRMVAFTYDDCIDSP